MGRRYDTNNKTAKCINSTQSPVNTHMKPLVAYDDDGSAGGVYYLYVSCNDIFSELHHHMPQKIDRMVCNMPIWITKN